MSKKTTSEKKIVVDEKTLQGLPIGVMLYDLEKIYFANKNAAEILGLNKKNKDIPKKIILFLMVLFDTRVEGALMIYFMKLFIFKTIKRPSHG